jgi:hypothetical protein
VANYSQGAIFALSHLLQLGLTGRLIRPPNAHVPAQGADESLEHNFGLESRFLADTMSDGTG